MINLYNKSKIIVIKKIIEKRENIIVYTTTPSRKL